MLGKEKFLEAYRALMQTQGIELTAERWAELEKTLDDFYQSYGETSTGKEETEQQK